MSRLQTRVLQKMVGRVQQFCRSCVGYRRTNNKQDTTCAICLRATLHYFKSTTTGIQQPSKYRLPEKNSYTEPRTTVQYRPLFFFTVMYHSWITQPQRCCLVNPAMLQAWWRTARDGSANRHKQVASSAAFLLGLLWVCCVCFDCHHSRSCVVGCQRLRGSFLLVFFTRHRSLLWKEGAHGARQDFAVPVPVRHGTRTV